MLMTTYEAAALFIERGENWDLTRELGLQPRGVKPTATPICQWRPRDLAQSTEPSDLSHCWFAWFHSPFLFESFHCSRAAYLQHCLIYSLRQGAAGDFVQRTFSAFERFWMYSYSSFKEKWRALLKQKSSPKRIKLKLKWNLDLHV